MVVLFRLIYLCTALLSSAAGVLVIASFFIADRAPHGTEFIGIHLAVGAVFMGLGVLLSGIQRHAAGIAVLTAEHGGETAQEEATHVKWLLTYLVVGGALLCAVLGLMTYAILARIDQGFAVFG